MTKIPQKNVFSGLKEWKIEKIQIHSNFLFINNYKLIKFRNKGQLVRKFFRLTRNKNKKLPLKVMIRYKE